MTHLFRIILKIVTLGLIDYLKGKKNEKTQNEQKK